MTAVPKTGGLPADPALRAKVVARNWNLIARALATEQISDDGRAAVARLHAHVGLLSAAADEHGLPAVMIQCTAHGLALMGHPDAIRLGDDEFLIIDPQRERDPVARDGHHNGVAHARSVAGALS